MEGCTGWAKLLHCAAYLVTSDHFWTALNDTCSGDPPCDGADHHSPTPVTPVTGFEGVVEIGLGYSHACALLDDNTLWCWGRNFYGQFGDGTTTNRSSPTPVLGLTGVIEIGPGGQHTCALLGDNTLRCWGWNIYGQLGCGTCDGDPPCSGESCPSPKPVLVAPGGAEPTVVVEIELVSR